MATIQSVKGDWTTLTAVPFTSGTINITGVGNASDLVTIMTPLAASGTFTYKGGDFQNTSDITVSNVAVGAYVGITGLDGSKVDQDTGVLEFYANTSGNLFLFSRK